MGYLEKSTALTSSGFLIMAASMFRAAAIIFGVGLGEKASSGIS
jgi:hypothetical protein